MGNENLSDENNKDVNIEYKKVDVSDWEVMNDFKTEFSMQNEDMMLKITFVIDTKTQVHPVIKIFRI
jgi:hypothetical protein